MSEPLRNAMTKADLISIVAKRLDITQVQSGIIVEAALRSIVSALQSGQEVEIRGFGSFRFRNRALGLRRLFREQCAPSARRR